MAWNPSGEVAIARDAAKQLGNASQCVILWVTPSGEQLGMVSYGKTKVQCYDAGKLGDHLYDCAMAWMAADVAGGDRE